MARPKVSTRELFVLGILSRHPTHGHGINRVIEVSEADRWVDLGPKHVYYVLRKLQREGWVSSHEEREGTAPPRTVHSITEAGREVLRTWLLDPSLTNSFPVSPFDTLFAMLAYADALDEDEIIAVLRERRAAIASALEEHTPAAEQELREHYGAAAAHMLRRTRMLLSAELEWIEDVLEEADASGWEAFEVPEVVANPER